MSQHTEIKNLNQNTILFSKDTKDGKNSNNGDQDLSLNSSLVIPPQKHFSTLVNEKKIKICISSKDRDLKEIEDHNTNYPYYKANNINDFSISNNNISNKLNINSNSHISALNSDIYEFSSNNNNNCNDDNDTDYNDKNEKNSIPMYSLKGLSELKQKNILQMKTRYSNHNSLSKDSNSSCKKNNEIDISNNKTHTNAYNNIYIGNTIDNKYNSSNINLNHNSNNTLFPITEKNDISKSQFSNVINDKFLINNFSDGSQYNIEKYYENSNKEYKLKEDNENSLNSEKVENNEVNLNLSYINDGDNNNMMHINNYNNDLNDNDNNKDKIDFNTINFKYLKDHNMLLSSTKKEMKNNLSNNHSNANSIKKNKSNLTDFNIIHSKQKNNYDKNYYENSKSKTKDLINYRQLSNTLKPFLISSNEKKEKILKYSSTANENNIHRAPRSYKEFSNELVLSNNSNKKSIKKLNNFYSIKNEHKSLNKNIKEKEIYVTNCNNDNANDAYEENYIPSKYTTLSNFNNRNNNKSINTKVRKNKFSNNNISLNKRHLSSLNINSNNKNKNSYIKRTHTTKNTNLTSITKNNKISKYDNTANNDYINKANFNNHNNNPHHSTYKTDIDLIYSNQDDDICDVENDVADEFSPINNNDNNNNKNEYNDLIAPFTSEIKRNENNDSNINNTDREIRNELNQTNMENLIKIVNNNNNNNNNNINNLLYNNNDSNNNSNNINSFNNIINTMSIYPLNSESNQNPNYNRSNNKDNIKISKKNYLEINKNLLKNSKKKGNYTTNNTNTTINNTYFLNTTRLNNPNTKNKIKDKSFQIISEKFERHNKDTLLNKAIKEFILPIPTMTDNFENRMIKDLEQRKNKSFKIKEYLDKNSPKIDLNQQVNIFNRLITDANRRIVTSENRIEMMSELIKDNRKKYDLLEWDEIYYKRFLLHLKNKNKVLEILQESKKQEHEDEENKLIQEIKKYSKKAPQSQIEKNTSRLYNDAERRRIELESKRIKIETKRLIEEEEIKKNFYKKKKNDLINYSVKKTIEINKRSMSAINKPNNNGVYDQDKYNIYEAIENEDDDCNCGDDVDEHVASKDNNKHYANKENVYNKIIINTAQSTKKLLRDVVYKKYSSKKGVNNIYNSNTNSNRNVARTSTKSINNKVNSTNNNSMSKFSKKVILFNSTKDDIDIDSIDKKSKKKYLNTNDHQELNLDNNYIRNNIREYRKEASKETKILINSLYQKELSKSVNRSNNKEKNNSIKEVSSIRSLKQQQRTDKTKTSTNKNKNIFSNALNKGKLINNTFRNSKNKDNIYGIYKSIKTDFDVKMNNNKIFNNNLEDFKIETINSLEINKMTSTSNNDINEFMNSEDNNMNRNLNYRINSVNTENIVNKDINTENYNSSKEDSLKDMFNSKYAKFKKDLINKNTTNNNVSNNKNINNKKKKHYNNITNKINKSYLNNNKAICITKDYDARIYIEKLFDGIKSK